MRRKLLIVGLAVARVSGLRVYLSPPDPLPGPPPDPVPDSVPLLIPTIELGITRAEVETLLGSPGKIADGYDPDTDHRQWGGGEATLIVCFSRAGIVGGVDYWRGRRRPHIIIGRPEPTSLTG